MFVSYLLIPAHTRFGDDRFRNGGLAVGYLLRFSVSFEIWPGKNNNEAFVFNLNLVTAGYKKYIPNVSAADKTRLD